jgi:predicted acylesterase/phospholipase RssA
MAFYLFLGKLSQIDTSGVQALSGASSGAILALLWVVFKGDIPEMLDFSLKVPIKTVMRPNIKNLLLNFGLVPLERVQKLFQTIFIKSFGKHDMTFGQLYKVRPVDLYISAFCVDRCETEYFSWKSHPGQSVIDALCASVAVPLLFSSVLIGPWRYVDGATQEEVPAMPFIGLDPSETLAIRTISAPPKPTKNLATFVMNIFSSALRLRHKCPFQAYHMDVSKVDVFDFGADRLRLFCDGQKSQTLVNATHHPVWPRAEEWIEAHIRQGEQGQEGVLVHTEGEQDARQGSPGLRCGDCRSAPAPHRPPQEGDADALRLSPS